VKAKYDAHSWMEIGYYSDLAKRNDLCVIQGRNSLTDLFVSFHAVRHCCYVWCLWFILLLLSCVTNYYNLRLLSYTTNKTFEYSCSKLHLVTVEHVCF